MIVNDRVRFKGPVYEHSDIPAVGMLGTLTERDGHTAQRHGHSKVELVTVNFDGVVQPVVVDISRLEPVS